MVGLAALDLAGFKDLEDVEVGLAALVQVDLTGLVELVGLDHLDMEDQQVQALVKVRYSHGRGQEGTSVSQ